MQQMRVPCAPPSAPDTQTTAFSTEKMRLSPSLNYYVVNLLHCLRPVYFANNPIRVSLLAGQGWRRTSTLHQQVVEMTTPWGWSLKYTRKCIDTKTKKTQKKRDFIADFTKKCRTNNPAIAPCAPPPNFHLWSLKLSYKTILICL